MLTAQYLNTTIASVTCHSCIFHCTALWVTFSVYN